MFKGFLKVFLRFSEFSYFFIVFLKFFLVLASISQIKNKTIQSLVKIYVFLIKKSGVGIFGEYLSESFPCKNQRKNQQKTLKIRDFGVAGGQGVWAEVSLLSLERPVRNHVLRFQTHAVGRGAKGHRKHKSMIWPCIFSCTSAPGGFAKRLAAERRYR